MTIMTSSLVPFPGISSDYIRHHDGEMFLDGRGIWNTPESRIQPMLYITVPRYETSIICVGKFRRRIGFPIARIKLTVKPHPSLMNVHTRGCYNPAWLHLRQWCVTVIDEHLASLLKAKYDACSDAFRFQFIEAISWFLFPILYPRDRTNAWKFD